MNPLASKRVLLGVSGGIAAYKAAEVIRRLRDCSVEVRVVMTRAATAFITPLTLQALSGQPVHVDLLSAETESAMSHIALARWADVALIAPASANVMAALAHGFATDLLRTLLLATTAPIFLAPAMNRQMWLAASTQANVVVLKQRGVIILGPEEGMQACGETGPGRMIEPDILTAALAAHFGAKGLAGVRVMVTAGPTREPIDPVRFISNRSSGKMGYAIAQAAAEAGAFVTLCSGPVALPCPANVHLVRIETAEEMAAAVLSKIDDCDILIAAAAVADYRPTNYAQQKLKKSAQSLPLALEPTTDILAAVTERQKRPFTVGFAAETERVIEHARDKLLRKKLDLIAANKVGETGLGFEAEENVLHLLWQTGEMTLERAPKLTLARQLVNIIVEQFHAWHKS